MTPDFEANPVPGQPPSAEFRSLLPLARGRLRDFRQVVRQRLVLSALSQLGRTGSYSPESVRTKVIEIFRFRDFPVETVSSELDALCDSGVVEHTDIGYRALEAPSSVDFEQMRLHLVNGFSRWAAEHGSTVDDLDVPRVGSAIESSMDQVTEVFVTDVCSGSGPSVQVLGGELARALQSCWTSGSAGFERTGRQFVEYLQSDDPHAVAFLSAVYQTALTVDILVRGQRLESLLREPNLPRERVFLDTNCLSALLNPTNRYHDVVVGSVKLAARFGFPVGYTGLTKDELDQLLASASRIMRIGNPADGARFNEFVYDFSKRAGLTSWQDRLAALQLWPTLIRDTYGIHLFPDDEESVPDSGAFSTIFETLLWTHHEFREDAAILRDKILYHRVESRRQSAGLSLLGTPVIETLDRYFAEAEAIRSNRESAWPVVIRASFWLALLSEFLDATFDDADVRAIGKSILRKLSEPATLSLSLEEYSKLLAARFELDPSSAATVTSVFAASIHRAELERALSRMDADQVTRETQQVLTDTPLIDRIVGLQRAQIEAAGLRDRMSRMGAELTSAREVNKYLREALLRPVSVHVSISGVSEGAIALMAKLLADVQARAQEESRAEGLDESLLEAPDAVTLRGAARKIQQFLETHAGTIRTLAPLIPVAGELLHMLGS